MRGLRSFSPSSLALSSSPSGYGPDKQNEQKIAQLEVHVPLRPPPFPSGLVSMRFIFRSRKFWKRLNEFQMKMELVNLPFALSKNSSNEAASKLSRKSGFVLWKL